MSGGFPSTDSSANIFIPALVMLRPIDLSKLRMCLDNRSACTVLSKRICKCVHEGERITLSSTYAEIPAASGCKWCKIALAQAVTGKFTSIIENEQPCANELVRFHVFRNVHVI